MDSLLTCTTYLADQHNVGTSVLSFIACNKCLHLHVGMKTFSLHVGGNRSVCGHSSLLLPVMGSYVIDMILCDAHDTFDEVIICNESKLFTRN